VFSVAPNYGFQLHHNADARVVTLHSLLCSPGGSLSLESLVYVLSDCS